MYLFSSLLLVGGLLYHKTLMRVYQGFHLLALSHRNAQYYILNNSSQIQDITNQLIADPKISSSQKQALIAGARRIVIFKYRSGEDMVAGYSSYLTNGEHPTIVFLRGGNRFLGIMRPTNPYSFLKGFNVIGTLYRGNIYGGKDDFGGDEIADVENLFKFFPQIERYTHKSLQPPFTIMGVSRGGMEMIGALSQSDYLKSQVNIAISISGNLDLRTCMSQRPEMKYLLHKFYKHSTAKNFEEWIQRRDPINNAKYLSKSLKFLLLYGLSDNNVSIDEQRNFINTLKRENIFSSLITIPQGNHGLINKFEVLENEILKFISD